MEGVCIVTLWGDGSVGFHIEKDMVTAQASVANTPVIIPNSFSYLFPLDTTTVTAIPRTVIAPVAQ